jgi:para-nitrobenzyl esterase
MKSARFVLAGLLAFTLHASGAAQSLASSKAEQTVSRASRTAMVRTSEGLVGGMQANQVAQYRAIPFAAPPVGELRWRAPQKPARWQGVRDGRKYSSTCVEAEDCLYLNVYTPAGAGAGDKLPVLVWIHGGSFILGAGSDFDGTTFAKKGLVVVTVNYRLGRAGWFSHPALAKNAPAGEAYSNYGLMDQIAALRWVKRNVAAFGGNPAKVTIAGESAGGVSVNYLMTSLAARGLFQGAISQSGFGRFDAIPMSVSEAAGSTFFSGLGIDGDTKESLAKMRAVPFERLAGPMVIGARGLILDGRIVQMTTSEAFGKGMDAGVPYLVGGNSNEASLYPTANPAARLAALDSEKNAITRMYAPETQGGSSRVVAAMVTDQNMTEPDRSLARQHAKRGSPVYRYYFSYLTPAERGVAVGVSHGGEIGYVWGRATQLPEDAATTQSITSYWAAFAKYGNPAAAGGPQWPLYDDRELVMEFGDSGPRTVAKLQNDRLDWVEQHRASVIASASAGNAPAAGR